MSFRKTRHVATIAAALLIASTALTAPDEDWSPAQWVYEDTIELGTTKPGEDLYWFPVWLVVIDDEVYVRLGSIASERFEESTTKPFMGVKIAGKEFPKVEGISDPAKAETVSELMREKYWTDIFVRWMDHPLTLRLEPK